MKAKNNKIRMPKIFCLLIILVSFYLAKSQTDLMSLVVDERIENKVIADVPAQDETFLKKEVLKDLKIEPDSKCADEFAVEDATRGYFTSRKAEQKAYLYRLCELGNNSIIVYGIVVVENGGIVAHHTFEDIGAKRIMHLTDVNENGSDEIVFHIVEEEASGIAIIELTTGGVKSVGCYQTFLHTATTTSASTIHVLKRSLTPGKNAPEFYEEIFRRRGSNWTKTKPLTKVALNRNCWDHEIFKEVRKPIFGAALTTNSKR